MVLGTGSSRVCAEALLQSPKPAPAPLPPKSALADGSISTITVQRQDIVAAFGLDGYLAAAQDDQRGGPSRAAAAKGGSTKKRR